MMEGQFFFPSETLSWSRKNISYTMKCMLLVTQNIILQIKFCKDSIISQLVGLLPVAEMFFSEVFP